jgi:hypothetical protein
MTDQIEALERLNKLKLNGTLTDEEFNAQKAAILAGGPALDATEPPIIAPRSGRLWLAGVASIVALCIAGGAYYLLSAQGRGLQFPGGPGNEATASADATQPAAFTQVGSSAVPGNASVGSPATGIQPPQEFLDLCVGFPGTSVREGLGFKLHRFVDGERQLGRTLQWVQSGDGWIMRAAWHDDVAQHDHNMSLYFVEDRTDGRSDDCGEGNPGVLLTRMVQDGVEFSQAQFGHTFVDITALIIDKDKGSRKPSDATPHTANSPNPAAPGNASTEDTD